VTTSLSGQVFELTPAGRFPLGNVEVLAIVLAPGPGTHTYVGTTTGTDGRYSFTELPAGSAVVRAFSPGRAQVCGALIALTATTQQDLEMTSTANPQQSPNPNPLRVTGRIYEMTPSGPVGLAGAEINIEWANDGGFVAATADGNGYYLACGIPPNRLMAFEVFRNPFDGYGGEYEIPRSWYQFSGDATLDFELKRRQ
jgi:hypothetical protein